MGKAKPNEKNLALEWLTELMERALDADAVELEIQRDGLEYTTFRGNSGVGGILDDRDFGWDIVQLVKKKAKVGMKFDGQMSLMLHGQRHSVKVRRYDVFGEPGLELRFRGEMLHSEPES